MPDSTYLFARTRTWGYGSTIVCAVLLFAASVGVMDYLPHEATWPGSSPILAGLIMVAVPAVWVACMSNTRCRLPDGAAVVALLAVTVLFAAWYARYWPQFAPFSDNHEALATGARQLLKGEFPWHASTFLGNPLSPMLGGFVLALPFVIIPGGIYLQQLVFYVLFTGFVVRVAGVHPALMATTLLLLSPHTRLSVPAGGDNWFVAMVVVMSASWGFYALRDEGRTYQAVLAALLFGVSMSYRATIWVAIVPVLVLFWRRFGPKVALSWFSLAGFVAALLVIGPLFIDAQAYLDGPYAMTMNKTDSSISYAGALIAGTTVLVTVLLSFFVRDLAGAWMALAGAMATMSITVTLTQVPVLGWMVALSSYPSVAYNGAWMLIGLVGLAMRRDDGLEQQASDDGRQRVDDVQHAEPAPSSRSS